MTGTTDKGSKSHLQPTKLKSSRRRAGDDSNPSLKVDDAHSGYTPPGLFQPDSLTFPLKLLNRLGNNSTSAGDGDTVRNINHEATKLGLGPVFFNLKPHHYHNSKRKENENICLDHYRKRNPEITKKYVNAKNYANDKKVSKKDKECDDIFESTLNPLCKGMKKLSLFKEEDVEIVEPNEDRSDKDLKKRKEKPIANSCGNGMMQRSFQKLVTQRIAYESGKEISVLVGNGVVNTFKKSSSAVRKAGVRNWKSPEVSSELNNGLLRSLFSWSLPTSTRWKEVEERMKKWSQLSKGINVADSAPTLEELADQLNITTEELQNLQFHKDLKRVVANLKNNICHSSLPWLSTLMAVSELQQGNHVGATRNATESQGTFLHSEIVDRHVCYLSRLEDANSVTSQRSSFSNKSALFQKQITDTLEFSKDSAVDEGSAFTNAISSFNPDWNIIQITAFLHSKNRFGMDLYGPRQIPQLLLSAIAQVPSSKNHSCFTTFCHDPPVQEGSMMRLGLMEEFQKILDQNLVISDDSVVISRRNYWEARNKHNQAMMCVIQAMEEDWIGPWNFLLPGHTKRQDLQDKICSKIIAPASKKYKLSSAQKLVLYKLTENYKYLHHSISTSLETVIAFILHTSETGLSALCKKIKDIGNEVPEDNRHPTILVIDQDLEIYPWESMNCLTSTDVTRMPSLNLINSNYNFVSSLRPTYPDIVDSTSCTFVLNPDGTLPNVQKRLEQYFLDHKDWVSVIGRPPATKEVQECLETQHIFLYNGHGAGSHFYPDYAVQKLVCQAVPMLMGCASAQAHYAIPRMYGSHTIHSYFLAGCPSVVGYLWEITDAECDRITVDLIERWLPDKNVRPPSIIFFDENAKRDEEKCLSTAMRISRKAATQFLTQCAIVCYGLPINTQK